MAAVSKFRLAWTLAGIACLGFLLTTWWILQGPGQATSSLQHVSILDEQSLESKRYATASQEELIELAEAETASLQERFPNLPAAINVKANKAFLLSDTLAAESSWKESLAVDPRNPDALFGLADLSFQAGEYDKTIALCEGLMRTNPGNPRVPLLLADAFLNTGQADLAVLALEQHIQSEPTSVQALAMLGTAQLDCENYNQAIGWFEQVLKYAPDSKDAFYGLGQAYTRQGEREKAMAAMERFSELADSKSKSNANEAQEFEDRLQAAHVAAQISVDAALVYKAANELGEARQRLLRAQHLQPNVVAWLEELQRVLQLLGEKQSATDVGERLVELAPDKVQYWLTLGGLYAELEKPEPAIVAFRKAIELAPEHPDCMAAKSIIEQLN